MPKLKPINSEEFAKKLGRAGYVPIRKNKHVIYFHSEKQITIPLSHKHRGGISMGLLYKLIKEMKLSVEEFGRL